MPIIKLSTDINASIEKCFNLSRSVDIHLLSAAKTNEIVLAGRTEGYFELNDIVTWKAKHFGTFQKLTVKITKMEYPFFFEDVMIKGIFKKIIHKHYFENQNGITVMIDEFEYEVPLGIIGNIFDKIVLNNYMRQFLITRNKVIKDIAENMFVNKFY